MPSEPLYIVASLAGYLDRKCDVRPGYKRFWRGYSKLQILCEAYKDGEKAGYERGVSAGYAMGCQRTKEEAERCWDMRVA